MPSPKYSNQEATLNDNAGQRQSGTSNMRPADPNGMTLHDRGMGFTCTQDPSEQGSDYSELQHMDIGEGTFTHDQLRARNIAREKAHNSAILAQNRRRGIKQ